MKTSPTIANLASALVQALPTLSNPAFDSVNPTFKTAKNPDGSGYASLAGHIAATKSPLAPFGLVVVQFPTSPGPDLVGIETVIITRPANGFRTNVRSPFTRRPALTVKPGSRRSFPRPPKMRLRRKLI